MIRSPQNDTKSPKSVCRDQLRENALLKKYYCDVNINDIINFNEELAHKLASEPAEVIPLVSVNKFRDECR